MFLQKMNCHALLYRIYKHDQSSGGFGLVGFFSSCSFLGPCVGKLCCYPSCSRCFKVASGRLKTIGRNFDVANCPEENVTQ